MGAKCCALIGRGDSGASDGKYSPDERQQAALRCSVRGSMYGSSMEMPDARTWNNRQQGSQWGAPPGGFPGQQPYGFGMGGPVASGDFGLGGVQQPHGSVMQPGGWGSAPVYNQGQAYGSSAAPNTAGHPYYVNQRSPPPAPQPWQGGGQAMTANTPPIFKDTIIHPPGAKAHGFAAQAKPKAANRTIQFDTSGADEYGVVRVGAKKQPAPALPAVAENAAMAVAPGFNGPATQLRVRNIAGDVVLACTNLQTANQNVGALKKKICRADAGEDMQLEMIVKLSTSSLQLRDSDVISQLMSIHSSPVMEVHLVNVVGDFVVPHPSRRAHRRKAA